MWDDDADDFYRFFRNRTNPFRDNDSYTFDLKKFFNNSPPFTPSYTPKAYPNFKATKFVTITISEGDDDAIEKAIALLESMKSKTDDSITDDSITSTKSESEDSVESDDAAFDNEFKEDNL